MDGTERRMQTAGAGGRRVEMMGPRAGLGLALLGGVMLWIGLLQMGRWLVASIL